MAKLPRREDLGAPPSGRSGRPIATYDVTAIGKGMQQFGRGIAQAGDAFASLEEHNDQAAAYETERRFQEFKYERELELDKLKQDMQPGQAGNFADAWATGYQKSAKEFFGTVPDKLKPRYDLRLFEIERGNYRDAATFGRAEQKRASINSLTEFKDKYLARPGNIERGKADYESLVEANPYLTPIEKDKLRREGLRDLENTHLLGMIERGEGLEDILKDLGYGPDLDTDENPELRAKPMSGDVRPSGEALIEAVIQQESGGRAGVVSKKGAVGLMQVMPDTAREIAAQIDPDAVNLKDDELKAYLKDPEVSRKYGSFYLNQMLERYDGDTEAALIAYNGGPRRADAWLAAGRDDKVIPKESANYYKEVIGKLGGGEQDGGKVVSFADFARGKGAATGYDAAVKAGIQPVFNQGERLGLEDAPLTTVQTRSGAKFTVAAPASGQVQGFLDELESLGYEIDPKQSGGYNDRNISGSNRKSQHAHGAAIDINWNRNKFDAGGTNDLPPNVGEIADKWGLSWGGYFKGSKKDTMHFEVARLVDGVPATGETQRFAQAQTSGTMSDATSGPKLASDAYAGPYKNLTAEDRLKLAHTVRTRLKSSLEGKREQLKQQFDDDVRSIRETGVSTNPDFETASRVLEPNQVNRYRLNREEAEMEFRAMNGLASLPDAELQRRLEAVEPKPGEDKYEMKAKVFDKVHRAVNGDDGLRALRENDPARSVAELPEVKQAELALREAPDDPEAIQKLARARIDAQGKVGIPEQLRSPITKREARVLVAPLRNLEGKALQEAFVDVHAKLQEQYGPYARAAAVSAIEYAVKSKDLAEEIEGLVSKSLSGQRITAADQRRFERMTEIVQAERAFGFGGEPMMQMGQGAEPEAGMPFEPDVMKSFGLRRPPPGAVDMLKANPSLAPQFNAKYGAGAAEAILAQ